MFIKITKFGSAPRKASKMNKYSNNRKQLQLATVLTGVMVPVIVALAILQSYYMLGAAIVVELALIVWIVALVKSTSKQDNFSTSHRD